MGSSYPDLEMKRVNSGDEGDNVFTAREGELALREADWSVGSAPGNDAIGRDENQDCGGPGPMGGELQGQGQLCTQPSKRRRLLGGETQVVWREGELDQGLQQEPELGCTEQLTEEEQGSDTDSADEDSEEIDTELPEGIRAIRGKPWGVAFRKASEHPWTDVQWVAYWQSRGHFLTPGAPFPCPLWT